MQRKVDERVQRARERCKAAGQEHVLQFWSGLDAAGREQLLADIEQVDFAAIPALAAEYVLRRPAHKLPRQLEPVEPLRRTEAAPRAMQEARQRGEAAIRAGRVAAVMVAGGQGTRLGLDGPKGCLPVSPVRGKALFQLFAEQILATQRRYDTTIRWYIMTSPSNDGPTRAYFEQNQYFGLAGSQLAFFRQGVMPAFAHDGRMILDQPGRLALSPDGHGGSLLAMARHGVLADMAARGVGVISYFQVDNPLVRCIDPLFIGLHEQHGSEMSSKIAPKADDLERVGNFVRADGKTAVIEYSDLPSELARARNSDGSRRFDAANLAIHLLSRAFVERLTRDPLSFALPWHRADKKVPYVDLQTGRRIEPAEPNAVKLEAFIFDALPLARVTMEYQTERAEEFSPVKNASGSDSLATAQRDMVRRAARWLRTAGVDVPVNAEGDPPAAIEIGAPRALEPADLRGLTPSPDFSRPVYLD